MTSEVVAEIEAQVSRMRETGEVPPGLEDELDERFEQVAEASLEAAAPATAGEPPGGLGNPFAGLAGPMSLAQIRKQATTMARRWVGPPFRRLERRAAIGVARLGEAASMQVHVTADHLERLAASSPLVTRVLSAATPGQSTGRGARTLHPSVEGPLFDWVLERLNAAVPGEVRAAVPGEMGAAVPGEVRAAAPGEEGKAPCVVLHAECGDGRVVQALAARGFDARGADPRSRVRADGDTRVVAAGALEYLGTTLAGTLDGLLLTGVVDDLRPGEGRSLAQLAARCLAPGGVVVLVSSRPEAVAAMDPVAADLALRRPLHPVTWCHLFARYGLSVLEVFEPETSEADIFAISAQRLVPTLRAGEGDA